MMVLILSAIVVVVSSIIYGVGMLIYFISMQLLLITGTAYGIVIHVLKPYVSHMSGMYPKLNGILTNKRYQIVVKFETNRKRNTRNY